MSPPRRVKIKRVDMLVPGDIVSTDDGGTARITVSGPAKGWQYGGQWCLAYSRIGEKGSSIDFYPPTARVRLP